MVAKPLIVAQFGVSDPEPDKRNKLQPRLVNINLMGHSGGCLPTPSQSLNKHTYFLHNSLRAKHIDPSKQFLKLKPNKVEGKNI